MGFDHRHPSSCTFGSAQFPPPNGHPPFNGIILWTRKAHNKTVQAKKSIYLIYLFCSLTARTTSTRGSIPSCFLEKEATLGGFGVALSGAGGKSLSDNDLDGWIEGFFVSQKSARLSHGLRLSCTCFMMKCRGYQSLAWFYIGISFFIGFSDHRHSNFPALGLMNLHYCNQKSQELLSLRIQSYNA